MSKITNYKLAACLATLLACCTLSAQEANKSAPAQQPAPAKKETEIDMKKLSEAFGNFIGRNLQSPGIKFDLESLVKGIRDGAAGNPAPMTDKEYEAMMAAVQEKAFKEMSTTNLNAANEFMQKNAKEAGVKEIVPGKLQFIVISEGTGPVVTEHAAPMIRYTGKYLDGTVFGTSEEMGSPITIPLDQTIPGFSKGLVNMKEGEKRKLFVHPDLGYGTTGQLPPNELLVFEVEIVKADSEKNAKSSGTLRDEDENDGDDDMDFDEDMDDDVQPTRAVPVPVKK